MIRRGLGLQTGSGRALRTGGSHFSCLVAANIVAASWCKLDGLAKWREMAILRHARYLSPPCRSLRLSPSPSHFSRNPHSTTSRPRDRKGRAGEGQSHRERGKGDGRRELRVEGRGKGDLK
jgi:hypothetical protein